MLSETAVSTILTAGITGAGIVIAIYTLVTPTLEKFVGIRRRVLGEKVSELYELRKEIDDKSSNDDIKQLSKLLKEIRELRAFPRYLSFGVLVSFVCFCFSVLFAFQLLSSAEGNNSLLELELVGSFAAGMASFVAVGGYTIIDTATVLREQWKCLERKEDETKKMTDEKLSQLEKDVEMLKRRGINPP